MTNCFTANPQFIFPVILNLFQDLTSELGRIPVDCLLNARFNAGEMLKRVQHDKKTQFAQRLCINEMLKRVTHDELFYFKSVSWICSARPYPPSAGREFRLSGFTTVGSICSLSRIHFIHSIRKSAKAIVMIFSHCAIFVTKKLYKYVSVAFMLEIRKK